jgi:uncharacterized protein YgiM (DUF1202 family)
MRWNSLFSIVTLSVFAILLFFSICPAQENLPFQGEVNANGINLRSDSTVSSAVIYTIDKGKRLEIISERYGWFKARLPETAWAYVKNNLVSLIDEKTGKVSKDRVNIRLKPNESSPIIGLAFKNEIINIRASKAGWYKIQATNNCFGWINKKFINKVSTSNEPLAAKFTEPQKTGIEPIKETAALTAEKENVSIEGIIRPYGKVFRRPATHKLISIDHKTFLLKGDKESLDALNYHKVKVFGKLYSLPTQKYPIIQISSIEIIE